MKILIPTLLHDLHAAAVALALERFGHQPIRWFCQDLPERATASFSIGSDGPIQISSCEGAVELPIDGIDVFWHRRVGEPVVKADELEPSDKQVALREATRFVKGLMLTISDRVYSVNDYQRSITAESKPFQLHVARELGFALPPTLMSNDPRRIKAFLRNHATAGTIYKSFKPVTWIARDKVATLWTSRVDLDALPDDVLVQLCPSIFQAYVPKAFEVRVTCMGAHLIGAHLDSQSTQAGVIDWRIVTSQTGRGEGFRVTPIEVPAEIATKCRSYLKRLGLVFGCFDFIVTPSGEWVFLEINQMGQFLWVESYNPEFPMLHMFCNFLISRDPEFRYATTERPVRLADVKNDALAMLERDAELHVKPDTYDHVVRE